MINNNAPLIAHTDWSRSWGGQEIRTLTEIKGMREKGFRCCLIVPEDSELAQRGREEGFPVYPVEFKSKFNLPSWKALVKTIREIRPSVLNTHSSEDSWMAGPVARLCGVPLVIRTRHVLSPVSSSISYNMFPHLILACSEAIRDGLIEEGISAEKIVVQPTGIDEDRFYFSWEKRKKIRAEYGIGESDILVGNVGFLREYKGQVFIVRTASRMPKNYKFMLVGGGQDLPVLQAEVAKLGVQDRFIFAGHQERPEDFFSAFDILFFSSWGTEGVAQALVQGLLYGLPLLLCKMPSVLETLTCVKDYKTIDYGDLDAACEGLHALSHRIGYDEQRAKWQRNAVVNKYGLESMMDNLTAIYSRYGITAG